MTIERTTVLDKLEVLPGSGLSVRLGIVLSENGTEINRQFHRTFIPTPFPVDVPDPVGFQMAEVAKHLAELGYPAMPEGTVEHITKMYALL